MGGLKNRFLSAIAHLVSTHPKKVIAVSIALAVLSGVISFLFLKLDTNQDNLISPKLDYQKQYQNYLKEFGDQEYIFVVFETPTKETKAQAIKALDTLASKLKNYKKEFLEIHDRIDLSTIEQKGLLFMPQDDFKTLITSLENWAVPLAKISQRQSYAELFDWVSRFLDQDKTKLQSNSTVLNDSFDLLEKTLQSLDASQPTDIFANHKSSLETGLSPTSHLDSYYFSQGKNFLFLFVLPQKDYETSEVIAQPLQLLRDEITNIKQSYPKLKIGITGRPVLQYDEMTSSSQGSVKAAVFALIGVSLLFFLFFESLTRPLLSLFCLILGILTSLGLTTLVIGHLNLLSLVFAIILIGLGIDFGIHFIFRYSVERQKQSSLTQCIETTLTRTGGAIVTGAISSAIAFLAGLATDFLGLQELGFIAGSGILLCLASQIITLPALLIIKDHNKSEKPLALPQLSLLESLFNKSRPLTLFLTLLTLAGAPFILRVGFEHNVLKLQSPHLESVQWEKRLIEKTNRSTWFAAITTDSLDDLKKLITKTTSITSIGHTESIFDLIPMDQMERLNTLNTITKKISSPEKTIPLEKTRLTDALTNLHQQLERLSGLAFSSGELAAVEKIENLTNLITRLQKRISNDKQSFANIIKNQPAYFKKLQDQIAKLTNQLNIEPVIENDLPTTIKRHFVSESGNYTLNLYPDGNIWEMEFMETFIDDVRQIDRSVTGAPITFYESAQRMQKGFYLVGAITLCVVMIILMVEFKGIKGMLISLCPLIVGMIWLTSLMGLLNIKLSLANFFALPILIGIGIDHGIHMVHRFLETLSITETLKTVAPPITLSSLTTCIGFGCLSIVPHPGLASFGYIMALGSLTCLLAALLIVPLVIKANYIFLK